MALHQMPRIFFRCKMFYTSLVTHPLIFQVLGKDYLQKFLKHESNKLNLMYSKEIVYISGCFNHISKTST